MLFKSKKPHFEYLNKKWTAKHRQVQNELWQKHGAYINNLVKNIPTRQIVVGGLGGLMMLTTPASGLTSSNLIAAGAQIFKDRDTNALLADDLSKVVSGEVRPLDTNEEQQIANILTKDLGFKVAPELEGIRLNRSYGLIGGEQHLYRFPGDNLYKHAESAADWAMFGPAGVAPGLGAWGYFSSSEPQFTQKDKDRERYYIAVQTFLAPGFAENVGKYRDFFKYRKMIVVNPKTGQSVVTVIGDAGPAEWTGKHLGGSPEVMHFLGLATGPRKGPVLYFFVDDSKDEIPLGPVKMKVSES